MREWEIVRLGDISTGKITNIAQKDLSDNEGEYPIYGASGLIKYVDFYREEKPYISVVKDGAGVGRTALMPAKSSLIGTMQYILPSDNVYVGYLYYAISRMNLSRFFTGATIPHIYYKDYKNEKITLPPFSVQKKIATILDSATTLIEKRKAQITKLDLLIKSQFVKMFGDPVLNPIGWDITTLGECGTLKNGMNFNQHDSGHSIHCLGVGNLGELYEIYGVDGFSKINLSTNPTKEYLLNDGDIVFVRSNGSKELVGRCVVVFPQNNQLTFSGFCIRFRNENPKLLITYLNHALHLPSLRTILIGSGRGANIQNVNQQMLSSLVIPLPPLDLQNRFIDFVRATNKLKSEIQLGLDKMELLYKSLIQKCFTGQLFDEQCRINGD